MKHKKLLAALADSELRALLPPPKAYWGTYNRLSTEERRELSGVARDLIGRQPAARAERIRFEMKCSRDTQARHFLGALNNF